MVGMFKSVAQEETEDHELMVGMFKGVEQEAMNDRESTVIVQRCCKETKV